MERFKTIKDFPDYQVSTDGRVLSFHRKKPRFLKPENLDGYLRVFLHRVEGFKCTRKHIFVHVLVAEAFMAYDKSTAKQVDHIDNDRSNNKLENLQILSCKDNIKKRDNNFEEEFEPFEPFPEEIYQEDFNV